MRSNNPRRNRPISARRLAFDVLAAVFAAKPTPAETAFDKHPGLAALSLRDRAFARVLYASVLRRLGQLDRALKPHLRNWPKDVGLLNCLRLGAVQLHHLETPAHAAIGETVQLAKDVAPFGAKMVNAVLRRVSATTFPDPDPLGDLPGWLTTSWRDAYGEPRMNAIATNLQQAPLDVSVPRNREVWAAALNGVPMGAMSLRLADTAAIDQLPGFDEGKWWVQDVAAAAIVPLTGNLKGKRVLDLCAAPGGKTAQLIAAGAHVTAVDSVDMRARRLKANLDRLGMSCEIVVEDARRYQPGQPFDLVLLDAPCSATGTLRRHPDIAWARRPADVVRLARLQSELLDRARTFVVDGGSLIYAVCSLQPEEGFGQIENFLHNNPDWRRAPFQPALLEGLPAIITGDGDYTSFPDFAAQNGGMDGFFAAHLTFQE